LQNKGGEVLDGKEAISQFKEWYMESYGVKPTEKLIKTFCKMKGIDIEQLRELDREEVAKLDETKECSMLNNAPVVTNVTMDEVNPHAEENYKALETTYQNLLAEHQEVCAIAEEQKNYISRLEARVDILSAQIKTVIKFFNPCRHHLHPNSRDELVEIEKYVEGLKDGNGTSTEVTK
jgi:archaellum component FlaC